ncbi:unnamed protein product [Caenorhabditis brenneri]
MSFNEKNVVFSAPYPGTMMRANNGIPILVEVSKVTTVAVPMTEGAIEIGAEAIKELIRSLKSMYETGKFLYDFLNIKGFINAGQGVGNIISGIIKFIPEPENPLVGSLRELENEVKQLEDQLSQGFDDIKSFMSELKFFVKIVSPVSVLGKLMRDCIKHPGPECVINFKEAYEERSPLNLMYSLISFLEQKSTNPIRLALDKGVCLTETFYSWNDIINNLLGQLLLLEAFATGLLGTNTQFNCEQIVEESKEVLTILEKIKNDYQIGKRVDRAQEGH